MTDKDTVKQIVARLRALSTSERITAHRACDEIANDLLPKDPSGALTRRMNEADRKAWAFELAAITIEGEFGA